MSNGYIGEEAAENVIPLLDGINIDLKGDDQFYRKVCGARLEPVEHNIELFWKKGVWVEVTTLIIPGYNDSKEVLHSLAEFLAGISKEIPWHISAFYPTYKMLDVHGTSVENLRLGLEIGREVGLKYVYAGNVPGESEDTFCSKCGEVQIERQGFRIMRNSVIDGRCRKCGSTISGIWS